MNKYVKGGLIAAFVVGALIVSYKLVKGMVKGGNENAGLLSGLYKVMAKINVYVYETPSYSSTRLSDLFIQGNPVGTVSKVEYDAATDETWLKVESTSVDGTPITGYAQKKSLLNY